MSLGHVVYIISLLLLGIHSFVNVRRIVYVVFSFLHKYSLFLSQWTISWSFVLRPSVYRKFKLLFIEGINTRCYTLMVDILTTRPRSITLNERSQREKKAEIFWNSLNWNHFLCYTVLLSVIWPLVKEIDLSFLFSSTLCIYQKCVLISLWVCVL